MRQRVTVIDVSDGAVTVKRCGGVCTDCPGACAATRTFRLALPDGVSAPGIGQELDVMLPEKTLVSQVVMGLCVPLVLVVVSTAAGHMIAATAGSIAGFGLGLIGGFVAARAGGNRNQLTWQQVPL